MSFMDDIPSLMDMGLDDATLAQQQVKKKKDFGFEKRNADIFKIHF